MTSGLPDLDQGFDSGSLYALRAAVAAHAAAAGLPRLRVDDVVAATHELAANVVRHGAGRGRLRLWADGRLLRCQVSESVPAHRNTGDRGQGPPWRTKPGHGLWLVGQFADQVSLDRTPGGTTATVTFLIPPPCPAPTPTPPHPAPARTPPGGHDHG
jgi:anti-sigma regulatory factor (Ser/Thr protein kinase)